MGIAATRDVDDVLLAPREVASLFGVTTKTIARWDAAGILAGERTSGGHRRFPAGAVYELLAFLEGVGDA
jgi:excisionase family DNA binding protein